ncbi:hypothetical protein C6W10_15445 [Plantactinospora sp. BB1]|nr:hypothetical protein C6W10_15445 [Plantactinospora sp. BB1]
MFFTWCHLFLRGLVSEVGFQRDQAGGADDRRVLGGCGMLGGPATRRARMPAIGALSTRRGSPGAAPATEIGEAEGRS